MDVLLAAVGPISQSTPITVGMMFAVGGLIFAAGVAFERIIRMRCVVDDQGRKLSALSTSMTRTAAILDSVERRVEKIERHNDA